MPVSVLTLTKDELSRSQLLELARVVDATLPIEVDCETFLARLAEYVERTRGMVPVAADLVLIRQHLLVCPECREDAEQLLRALGNECSCYGMGICSSLPNPRDIPPQGRSI